MSRNLILAKPTRMQPGYTRISSAGTFSTSQPTDDDVWSAFGPIDHVRLLHGETRKGRAILVSASPRGKKRDWREADNRAW